MMSCFGLTGHLFRSSGLFLLLALSASPRASEKVLARIDRRQETVVPDRLASQIEVLQKLQTCLIARIPEELTAALAARGIRLEVLDTAPGRKPYFMVYHSAADESATLALYGEVRRIEDGISIFWTGSENVREMLPPQFVLKRLPDRTSLRFGTIATPPAFGHIRADLQNPAIANMVRQVSRERLAGFIQNLQDFRTRYASTANCEAAGDYIHAYFAGLGLSTRYDPVFFGRGDQYQSRNIVAEIPGRTSPEYSVILCAHYDSYSKTPGIEAPGADDNASGTATVMELARILAGSSFDFTIRFICFSAEEWGLYGSRQYAGAARSAGEEILAVLNLDMVAYADLLPEDLEVFSNPESEWLLDRFAAAATRYTALGIDPRVDSSFWRSDHSPFWDQGFSAICGIEDMPLTNTRYHTTADTLDTLNLEFLTLVAQATLAAAADLAQPVGNQTYLPHVANGSFATGSFRTTFILFNNTDNDNAVLLRATGDAGGPLALTIPGLGTASEFTMTLAPGASRIFQTDGSGSLVAGAATVTSALPIGLSSIFSTYDAAGNLIAEAGVGASSPVQEFVIPVDAARAFNTGLAMLNPWPVEASVQLKLVDNAGYETAQAGLTIAPGAHRAAFVAGPGQLFPTVTAFRGALTVRSSSRLSALALRQTGMPLSYSSLPVVHGGSVRHSLVLPHIANGSYGDGSFRSSFLILNPSPIPANVTLSLTKSDGTPLSTVLQGKGLANSFDLQLGPNGSVFLQTDGSGPLTVGAASISSDVPVDAAGIFSVFDSQGQFQTETGVGSVHESSSFTLPVDVTGNFNTGVAFFNPGNQPVQMALRLLAENGELMRGETQFTLPARHHRAIFVSELFPGITNFRGTLAVSGGNVAALVLRQHTSPLSYTTLPVKEGISHGTATPLVPP